MSHVACGRVFRDSISGCILAFGMHLGNASAFQEEIFDVILELDIARTRGWDYLRMLRIVIVIKVGFLHGLRNR